MMPDKSFWKNKHVLITGHSGFKGSWLAFWLNEMGAKVTGVSLPPITEPNLFSLIHLDEYIDSNFIDIKNTELLTKLFVKKSPDIVFHLAAQPLVRASYKNPQETFNTNIMGTVNVLEAIRTCGSVKSVVIITTDKVYKNMEWAYPYRENDPLGGHDPYSASKAATEIVVSSYRDAFFQKSGIAIATARAGNVIGGGDWSEDRLIPDAIRAWETGTVLNIRSPQATRPWQHVLEPLTGYLSLARAIWNNKNLEGSYNFGPEPGTAATVKKVITYASKIYGRGKVIYTDDNTGPHEAGLLTLEIAKSASLLGISPKWSLTQAIDHTMNWYLQYFKGRVPRELCRAEIAHYENEL